MSDPIPVLALVISIASVLFVALREGSKLMFEFRESEVTISRKKDIDKKLAEQFDIKLNEFLNSKGSKEEKCNAVEELGKHSFIVRSLSNKILDSISHRTKLMLRFFFFGVISSVVAVIIGVLSITTENISLAVIYTIYLGMIPAFSFYVMFQNYSKGNSLREAFRKLYENSTLELSQEIYEELTKKQIL
jgi:hypothetical protein